MMRAAIAVAMAGVLLLMSGTADAATRVFTDPDDSDTIDIREVRVSYAQWLRVRVKHDGRVRAGQVYAFWMDTRRRNRGPEYYADFRPNADGPTLERVSGFGDTTRTEVRCDQIGGGADFLRPRGDVTFRVAGSCLRDPDRVRIAVHFRNADGSSADWAPATRRLYPPVRRS